MRKNKLVKGLPFPLPNKFNSIKNFVLQRNCSTLSKMSKNGINLKV